MEVADFRNSRPEHVGVACLLGVQPRGLVQGGTVPALLQTLPLAPRKDEGAGKEEGGDSLVIHCERR